MTFKQISKLGMILALTLNSGIILAEYQLRHDPFESPLEKNGKETSLKDMGKSLDLRATLVSSTVSFANISGTILSVGEVFNGYKLISVKEGMAILDVNGHKVTKYVSGAENAQN